MSSIISVPHPTLRAQCELITTITTELQEEIQDLIDALKGAHNPEGVGLSFPQIGIKKRGFATYLEKKIKIYLNPEILDQSEETTLGGTPERPTLEGCLSIPHLYGPVPRAKKIKIKAIDEHGVEVFKTLSSFPARVFLHEQDHLDGILFTDYTIRHNLPLYFLDQEADKFIQVEDPKAIIKW
jgi:peptide deformylase